MKVAILCRYYPRRMYSGSYNYNKKLIEYLSREPGLEVHVVTLGEEEREFTENNITFHILPKGILGRFSLVSFSRCKKIVEDIRPDIVHAISASFLYATALVSLKNRYPVLLTLYGVTSEERKYLVDEHLHPWHYLTSFLDILHEGWVLRSIPNIIIDSRCIENYVRKLAHPARIKYIAGGVEYDYIQGIQRTIDRPEYSDIFFVNNLQQIKGADILLHSLRRVKKAIPDIKVIVAGTGPQEPELRRIAETNQLETNVHFIGSISDQQKYQLYKTCKLVVVPSRWDCQPAALFDAIASEKPVIASDKTNQEVIQDGVSGFIFHSGDVNDLADKIILLLKDGCLRERMGRMGKEKAIEYDWKNVARQYIETFSDLVKESKTNFNKE